MIDFSYELTHLQKENDELKCLIGNYKSNQNKNRDSRAMESLKDLLHQRDAVLKQIEMLKIRNQQQDAEVNISLNLTLSL